MRHACAFRPCTTSAGAAQRGHATALKPPHKAGRRGGDSIAREGRGKLFTLTSAKFCGI